VAVITFPAAKVKPVFVHVPAETLVVPCVTPPLNTSIVAPSASVLVPLTAVEPAQIGEVITGVAVTACTVTDDDNALTHLPVAWAVAVITSPDANVKLVFVHTPALTVVVPCDTAFLNTVIVVPVASVLVPLTDVAPAHIGEVTTGTAEKLCTVTDDDNALTHLPEAWAVAVMISPLASAVNPVNVHAPAVTVVIPCDTPPLNTSIDVPLASPLVPLTAVAPAQIGEVITGVAVTA